MYEARLIAEANNVAVCAIRLRILEFKSSGANDLESMENQLILGMALNLLGENHHHSKPMPSLSLPYGSASHSSPLPTRHTNSTKVNSCAAAFFSSFAIGFFISATLVFLLTLTH